MAKRKPFNPGWIEWTKEDYKVISWCLKNQIGMCVVPARSFQNGKGDYCVEIIMKGKSTLSPNYKKQIVLEKQKEYYYYYYDKYNKTKV